MPSIWPRLLICRSCRVFSSDDAASWMSFKPRDPSKELGQALNNASRQKQDGKIQWGERGSYVPSGVLPGTSPAALRRRIASRRTSSSIELFRKYHQSTAARLGKEFNSRLDQLGERRPGIPSFGAEQSIAVKDLKADRHAASLWNACRSSGEALLAGIAVYKAAGLSGDHRDMRPQRIRGLKFLWEEGAQTEVAIRAFEACGFYAGGGNRDTSAYRKAVMFVMQEGLGPRWRDVLQLPAGVGDRLAVPLDDGATLTSSVFTNLNAFSLAPGFHEGEETVDLNLVQRVVNSPQQPLRSDTDWEKKLQKRQEQVASYVSKKAHSRRFEKQTAMAASQGGSIYPVYKFNLKPRYSTRANLVRNLRPL